MSTHTAETFVVRGGVMGLASTRGLARREHSVTLLERSQPGHAALWASGLDPVPAELFDPLRFARSP